MHLQFVESESTFAYFDAARAYLEGHRQLDGCGREKLGGEVEAAVRRPRQRR